MKTNGAFETVLAANKDYTEAVENNARKEVQENLLTQATILFKAIVLDRGLANEYSEYCEAKMATGGLW